MKQNTAIRRAIALKGFYDQIRRRGDYWEGRITGMPWVHIAHNDDMRTVDHNGHSTRVYMRDTLVATVYGQVEE